MEPTQKTPDPVIKPAFSSSHELYYGFDLKSVTWGYRDIFEKVIDRLYAEGYLGKHREKVTETFFNMLKKADKSCFDNVLRNFIGALTPETRWIMDIPGMFCDLTELGAEMAENKLYRGIKFFEVLAKGGMGRSPQQMRDCLTWTRRLLKIDPELAVAFLNGYLQLSERLTSAEMERYMEVALKIHQNNQKSAYAFIKGELNTSETYILSLTNECRLNDVREQMKLLLLALTGNEFEIEDLSKLDSDDIIEHGTQVLSLERHLYLPSRIRMFKTFHRNRDWYMLTCVAAAGMIVENSFPRIHGRPGYESCAKLMGDNPLRLNLFTIIEYIRVLRGVNQHWPGARRLVDFGINQTFKSRHGDAEQLFCDIFDDRAECQFAQILRKISMESPNCFAVAERIDNALARNALSEYPGLAENRLQPSGFLSDFCFPTGFAAPTNDRLVADLKKTTKSGIRKEDSESQSHIAGPNGKSSSTPEHDAKNDNTTDSYAYNEWDFTQNDYRPDWCRLQQIRPEPHHMDHSQFPYRKQSKQARAFFERLRPAIVRREKQLEEGDNINIDMLIRHVVERRRAPGMPARFYEKPLINKRDLSVLVLLDVSGSTGEQLPGGDKVIDLEKQAAVILGEGLSAIGDRFAVCGFSSNGHQNCKYYIFKDFHDNWDAKPISRVMSAWPGSSTRIGPALRHSGFMLTDAPSKQRLIILITDGKPMDQDYDPNTRYAQHDVRMACEENARREIHTFAISTDANSPADMDIMFPQRRFVLLPDINSLPRILPGLYLRLTL